MNISPRSMSDSSRWSSNLPTALTSSMHAWTICLPNCNEHARQPRHRNAHMPLPPGRGLPPPPASPPPPPPAPPPKPTAKKRGKRKTKARKPLPATFVPLSTFRQLHRISDKAVEYAMEKQKLTVKRGRWRYDDGRTIMIALDAQGRQQFYELFYERQGFQRCDDC